MGTKRAPMPVPASVTPSAKPRARWKAATTRRVYGNGVDPVVNRDKSAVRIR